MQRLLPLVLVPLASTLMLASCAPLRAAVNTQASQPLAATAPLAAGQTWNVQGSGLVMGGQTQVAVDVVYANDAGNFANMDGTALRELAKGNGKPGVIYNRLRQQLTFQWNGAGGTYNCVINDVNPAATSFKGQLQLSDNVMGSCTAALQ